LQATTSGGFNFEGMLERIAATLLSKYLGEYVKGLERDNLHLNVIGGDVVLEHLELKTEALANLELPIEIKRGFLGRLALTLPWKSLGSTPAIAKIHELFVVIGPKTRSAEDDDTSARETRLQHTKLRRLQLLELLRNKDDLEADEEEEGTEAAKKRKQQRQQNNSEGDGFMKRLITKVVDNLQVYIDKVHIRYEDEATGLAFGITLEDLRAHSTDDNFRPAFLSGEQPNNHLVHKLVSLSNFAVYWNPPGSVEHGFSSHCQSREQLETFLNDLIHQTHNNFSTEHQFVLQPVSGELKVILNKRDLPDPLTMSPKVKLDFVFKRVGITLAESQFRGFLRLFDHLDTFHRRFRYLHLRPPFELISPSVSASVRAQSYWKFLLGAIRITIQEKKEAWNWERMSRFRRDRIAYVGLFQKKIAIERGHVGDGNPNNKKSKEKEEEINQQLARYEKEYDYEHIKIFRDLAFVAAKQYLKRRKEKRQKDLEEKKKKEQHQQEQQQQQQPTFWNRWFGGGSATATTAPTSSTLESYNEDLDEQLANPQTWKELFAAVDYDENEAKSTQPSKVPKGWVKTQMSFALEQGVIALKELEGKATSKIAEAVFNGFHLGLFSRDGGSTTVNAKLQEFNIDDYYTLPGNEKVETLGAMTKSLDSNILEVVVNTKPLDRHADTVVQITGEQPLQIVFSRRLVDRIAEFFKDKDKSQLIASLQIAAAHSYEDLKKQAQSQLKEALERKKTLDLRLSLKAPTILLPEDFTNPDSSLLVVDLGSISFTSDLAKFNKVPPRNEDGEIELEYCYDKFTLGLTRLGAVLTKRSKYSSSDYKDQATMWMKDPRTSLIDYFDLEFGLGLCTVPSPILPKVKLTGALPSLVTYISAGKCGDLLKLLKTIAKPTTPPSIEAPKRPQEELATTSTTDGDHHSAISRKKPLRKTRTRDSLALSANFLHNAISNARERAVTNIREDKKEEITSDPPALEINVHLGRISAVLQSEGRNILDISIVKVNVSFTKWEYHMGVNASLGQLSVLDLIQTHGPRYQYVIASHDITKSIEAPSAEGKQQELIRITYNGIPPDSPKYKGLEHDVLITFNTLHVGVNLEAIATVLAFADELSASLDAADSPQPSRTKLDSTPKDLENSDFFSPGPGDTKSFRSSIMGVPQLLKIKVRLNQVALSLNKGGGWIATASLSKILVHVNLAMDKSLQVHGSLGSINVNSSYELWPNVISTMGDKMVKFTFEKHTPEIPTLNDPEYLSLDLQMGSVQAVYLAEFVRDVTDYFSELDSMKSLLSSTAKKVKSEALKQAEEANQSKKDLTLSVIVEKPSVIIPQSAQSANAVVGALGKISVANKILSGPRNLRLDSLSIDITAVNLHSLINNNTSSILDDTNVNLILDRPVNAQPEDFVNTPKLAIKTTISSIQVYFSPPQMSLFLDILSDNLAESSPGKNLEGGESSELVTTSSTSDSSNSTALSSPSSSLPSSSEPIFDLQLTVNLEKIAVFVYKGNDVRSVEPLLAFAVSNLGLDLSMFSDDTMKMNFVLRSIILQDSRTGSSNRFPKMIEPTSSENDLVNMSYKKLRDTETPDAFNQDIVININSPIITVVAEVICDLKDFALEQVEVLIAGLDKADAKKRKKPAATSVSTSPSTVVEEKKGMMKLELSINEPIVYVLDNAADSSAEALVTHATIKLDLIQQHTGQEITVQLKNFELSKCRLSPLSTTSPTVNIVDSFNGTLSLVESEVAQNIMLTTTALSTVISYQDIRLAMRIAERWVNRLKVKSTSKELKEIASVAAEKVAKKAEDLKKSLNINSSQKQRQLFSVNLHSLRFTLIDDCTGSNDAIASNIQLLKGSLMGIEAQFKDWAEAPSGYLNLQIKLQYFNSKLEALEPMIEPWPVQIQFNSEVLEEASGGSSTSTAVAVAQDKRSLHLTVASTQQLNINITRALLETTFKTIETWKEDYEKQKDYLPTNRTYHPFYLRNETGKCVTYWLTERRDAESDGSKKTIPSGEEQPIDLFELNSRRSRKVNTTHSLSLEIEGLPFLLHDLPFSKVGENYIEIPLDRSNPNSEKKVVVFEVALRLGSKVATLRSNTAVVNRTSFPLDIYAEASEYSPSSQPNDGLSSTSYILSTKSPVLSPSGRSRLSKMELELPLAPGSTYSVPLEYAWKGFLKVRPHDSPFSWSEERILCLAGGEEPFYVRCAPRTKTNTPWLYVIKPQVKRETARDLTSQIQEVVFAFHPPMRIENRLVCDMTFAIKEGNGPSNALSSPFGNASTTSLGSSSASSTSEDRMSLLPRGKDIDVYQVSKDNANARSLVISMNDFRTAAPVVLKGTFGNAKNLNLVNPQGAPLELSIENVDTLHGTNVITLFSQYWLINKTGLPLKYKDGSNRILTDSLASSRSSNFAAILRENDPRRWYIDDPDRAFPVMFSGRKIHFRIHSSKWSKALKLGSASSMGVLGVEEETEEKRDKLEFAVAISASDAPGKYRRTKIITFYPNFVLANTTEQVVVCAQVGSRLEYTLEPGEQVPFHWPNILGRRLMKVRFRDDSRYSWSSEFQIDQFQNFEVKMLDTLHSEGVYRLGVKVRLEEATTVIVLAPETKEFPDYLIDNQSTFALAVQQKGVTKAAPITVDSGTKIPYVWDEVYATKKKLMVSFSNTNETKEYNFDKLKLWPPIVVDNHYLTVEVLAEGPTKVLRLFDKRYSTVALPRLTDSGLTAPSEVRIVTFSFQLGLAGIGLSLIDETPQEILFICLEGISLAYEESQLDKTFEVKLNDLQIDNQLYITPYPITVFAIPAEGQAFLHLSLVKSQKFTSIDYFNYLAVQMQELDIRLEENVLLKLLGFVELILDFFRRQKGDTEVMNIFHPDKKQVYLSTAPETLTKVNKPPLLFLSITPHSTQLPLPDVVL
jgi:vacuolar protein sorting-associated protein 13A/C